MAELLFAALGIGPLPGAGVVGFAPGAPGRKDVG